MYLFSVALSIKIVITQSLFPLMLQTHIHNRARLPIGIFFKHFTATVKHKAHFDSNIIQLDLFIELFNIFIVFS